MASPSSQKTPAPVPRRPSHGTLPERRLIRAVLFDLDGTLYDAPEYTAAFRKEVIAFAARRLRRRQAEIRRLLRTAEQAGKSLTQTLAEAGLPKREWHEAMARKTSLFGLIPRDPSVRSLFWALRARGYRIGVLTNAPRKIARRVLSRLGISPADYSLLVTGSEVKPKPSPEPFVTAAQAIGAPLDEIAYVGDRLAQEVLPSVRLGIMGILVKGSPSRMPRGVLSAPTLQSVPAVLAEHTTPPPQPVVWISGRPAAGKTTVARALQQLLHARGVPCALLDSDHLRQAILQEPAFTPAEKDLIYRLLFTTARTVSEGGAIAIISATGYRRELRREARGLFSRYLEVYLDCPIATAIQRDPKSLYARALAGHISTLPGISLPYDEPDNPDLTIDTTRIAPDRAARIIFNALAKI